MPRIPRKEIEGRKKELEAYSPNLLLENVRTSFTNVGISDRLTRHAKIVFNLQKIISNKLHIQNHITIISEGLLCSILEIVYLVVYRMASDMLMD